MIPTELLKRIRRIQIYTSSVVDDLLAGQWNSAFKGRGIEFEEVRPYQVGDDVRAIDWNVTARSGEPYIKLFREERELSIMLLVDMSSSQLFGTQLQTKRELVAEISGTLAYSAIKNNDKVGMTLFTDGIEKAIPPRKGSKHVLRLIRDLLHTQPIGHGTSINTALEHLNRTLKRRTVTFLISDFLDSGFEQTLKVTSRRHDLIPLIVCDEREFRMPNVGQIRLQDSESGRVVTLDTFSRRVRAQYERQARERLAERDAMFRRLRLEPIHFYTGENFVEPLVNFFRRRELRR